MRQYIHIENSYLKYYCIFNLINAALVSKRDLFNIKTQDLCIFTIGFKVPLTGFEFILS